MDWNIFCNNIKEMLELKRYTNSGYLKWNINDTELLIEYYFEENKIVRFTYNKEKFDNDYKDIQEQKELKISSERYYEIPISSKNEFFSIAFRHDRLNRREYNDDENNLRYKISYPSKQFWLKIIELKVKQHIALMFRRIAIYEGEFKFKEGIAEKDIFELLRVVFREYITLQIFSEDIYKEEEFSKLADAFIFNVNYNTDIGIRQIFDIESIHARKSRNRFRNESLEEIPTPKKIYNKELLEQYNMASISEDPFTKYLCYYHILEHFYEAVSKEDLIRAVREQLTSPGFSVKKDNEISKLINTIKKKIKYDKEYADYDELESLELVLKKYIDAGTIKDEIKYIEPTLINYYNIEKVKFSGGNSVNFNDVDNLYKNIAKRIYFTRNALVHYKSNNYAENERGMYSPFRDKEELLKEIPLIRILAENVITKEYELI